MKKPLSGILSNLIVLAEEIITRPQRMNHQGTPTQDKVARLGVEIREADQQIYEGEPATAAGVVMITCIEQAILHQGKPIALHWLAVAGATLPLLREESFIAFRNEREAARP